MDKYCFINISKFKEKIAEIGIGIGLNFALGCAWYLFIKWFDGIIGSIFGLLLVGLVWGSLALLIHEEKEEVKRVMQGQKEIEDN